VIRIYHVKGTRSLRPIWLCYELGLPVEIETIDFSPSYRNTPAYRAISPAGKVPAMTDGDVSMFESGAIVDYILERYGEGQLRPPPGTPQSALYRQWCWFAEATLARPVGLNRLLTHKPATPEAAVQDTTDKANAALAVVDDAIAGRAFLLGTDFTAADIMTGYSLELLASLKVLDTRYTHALSYLERLRAREAFKRAASA
jgi:glutathione S-transferase